MALQFIPYDFGVDDSKWTHISLDNKELEIYSNKFSVENPLYKTDLEQVEFYDSFIESIQADFCIVNIKRNWFRNDIIESNFIENNPSVSYYPERLIFIKNVDILLLPSLKNSDIDLSTVFLKFGPMLLQNQFFLNSNLTSMSLQPVKNKGIYKSKNFSNLNKNFSSKLNKLGDNTVVANQPLTTSNKILIQNINKHKIGILDKSNIGTSFNATLINKFNLFNLSAVKTEALPDSGMLILKIKNQKNISEVINKCEVTIIGINNQIIKALIANDNGEVNVLLPIGQYNITLRKDGFTILEFKQDITSKNNTIIEKTLDPTNISYNSIFLIGVCLKSISL